MTRTGFLRAGIGPLAIAFAAAAGSLASAADSADGPRGAALQARIAAKLDRLEAYERGRSSARPPAANSATQVASSSAAGSETVKVNCNKGRSVSAAIAGSKASRVRVEVSGTCAETVVVERIGVTISGTAAGGAVIDPPDVGGVPTGPALRALGAHDLTLEDLDLTGGLNGLEASASRGIRLTRVSAVSNAGSVTFVDGYGVFLEGSEATIVDSDISFNSSPVVALSASQASIFDSSITDNTNDGPFSINNSDLLIARCTMARNPFGPQAGFSSRTRVADSTVDANLESFATGNSILTYIRSSVQTEFLAALDSSRLELRGTTFQALGNPADGVGLHVSSDSYAQAQRARRPDMSIVESNITADVFISQFSDASFSTGAALQGAVTCSGRSRVTTNLTPTGGTTGCE